MVEIDVAQIMATLAAMVVVISGIFGAGVYFRKWITGLAASASRAEQAATVAANHTTAQLRTSNGHTVGQYVEQTHGVVKEMREEFRREIGSLASLAASNHDAAKLAVEKAERAEALAQLTADRFEAHLATYHQPPAP